MQEQTSFGTGSLGRPVGAFGSGISSLPHPDNNVAKTSRNSNFFINFDMFTASALLRRVRAKRKCRIESFIWYEVLEYLCANKQYPTPNKNIPRMIYAYIQWWMLHYPCAFEIVRISYQGSAKHFHSLNLLRPGRDCITKLGKCFSIRNTRWGIVAAKIVEKLMKINIDSILL